MTPESRAALLDDLAEAAVLLEDSVILLRAGHLAPDDASRAARAAIDRITRSGEALRRFGDRLADPGDLLPG
jgi:hypothetical protein